MPTEAGAPGPVPRIRLRFACLGRVRFVSQRDLARAWERALRRSGLPVAWSEGFSPRPLLSFGLGLPTGCESTAEYLDIRLSTPWDDVAGLPQLLTPLLPRGLSVLASATVPHPSGSLQQQVTSCSWELEVDGLSQEELGARIQRVLASPTLELTRVRKGVEVVDDIRPQVLRLEPLHGPGAADPPHGDSRPRLAAELATRPRGVRPTELVQGLGADVALFRARRTQQWIERDGARLEPLPLETPSSVAAPVARVRAT